MPARSFTRAMFGVIVATTPFAAGTFAADKPNIVVIISDDAGWADFGFQNAITGETSQAPTPNLDALANGGVRFGNAYASPVCGASRAMLVTGRYGGRFGHESNLTGTAGNTRVQGVPSSEVTLWEHLQDAGYQTATVGKWHLGDNTDNISQGVLNNRPQAQGVENFQGLLSGSRSYFIGNQTNAGELRRTLSDGAGGVVSDQVIENQHVGEYVTDTLGDFTADYIRNNATADKPFVMYNSFTAPHTPMQATQADLAAVDALGLGVTGNRRTLLAMQIALDRNVGKILDALDNPDGNQGTNDSIRDNTLIMFVNDNGGDCCDGGPNFSDNGPLRDGKGTVFEGGMRVPMIVAGAGVSPSVEGSTYDGLVHVIDIVPTALAAAGGTFSGADVIDGVNLLPHINGETHRLAHDDLWLRGQGGNDSAIRHGDWKLVYQPSAGFQLYDLATDIGESSNVAADHPEIVNELKQRSTGYEVQMVKPVNDLHAPQVNRFDEFRFREEAFDAAVWNAPQAWENNQTGANATMNQYDGYANAVLVFQNKSEGDYTATNNLVRQGGQEMMANEIRLENDSGLTGDGTATIAGLGVLMTKSHAGEDPKIRLDATNRGPSIYTYNVALELQLYDDLEITGDGNQKFALSGGIREYRPGRSITKTGSAEVSVGPVDISGAFDAQAGAVELTSEEFRGDFIARSGVAVRLGPNGIVPGDPGSMDPPPEIVQGGLDLNFDAALDTAGDAEWTDASPPGPVNPLLFPSGRSPIDVNSATFAGLTKAYANFVQSGGAQGLFNHFETGSAPKSEQDGTFEVVFNVTDTNAGVDQVIFEAGGAPSGVSFILNNNTLSFTVDGDGGDLILDANVSTGWHHAVGVIDLDESGGADTVSLYLNNVFVGSLNADAFNWSGGNQIGIGEGFSSVGGVSSGVGVPFHGEVASTRFYTGVAFGANEVNQNFEVLTYVPGDPGQPAVALLLDGDFTLEAGSTLQIDLLDTDNFDRLEATGQLTLAGVLFATANDSFNVSLGDAFTVLSGEAIVGELSGVALPQLSEGQMWQVTQTADRVSLLVTIAGDYNADGQVDGADYAVWREMLGVMVSRQTAADGNGDGVVNAADYAVWKQNFGAQTPAAAQQSAVPEPSTVVLLLLAMPAAWSRYRRRRS